MSEKISGAEYCLAKIFSSEFEYVIPPYQRPYAWKVDQASELFDDLLGFYQSDPAETGEPYFLGSIVLIKESSKPLAEVIDGQQRLTTLTILLCAIASVLEESEGKEILEYIRESGKKFEGLEAKPRLTLRERDKDFFSKHVQALNFDALISLDDKGLDNEAQINIKKNSQLFLQRIESLGNSEVGIEKFITFLVKRCFLVVVSTPSQQSAFRVFSVMNSRGLDLQMTDIIKANIIGQLANEKEREEYNERWEDMEAELGRDGFNNLFAHVRMIYAKEKARKSILEEFRNHVLKTVKDPKVLIDDVLEPYADALATVRTASYEAVTHAEKVNTYLRWLNRIDNSDWIPVAIWFLSKHKNEPEYLEWFFSRLERLAAYMHVCALNINKRIQRYSRVITELEGIHPIDAPVQSVELSEEEKGAMRGALDGNIYELMPARRRYLILRLDSFVADGAASYDPGVLTIEHVLPQMVNGDSQWAKWWPDEQEREQWVHRIANLVPLSKRRNSRAQNYDLAKKIDAYFKGNQGVTSYALTTQVSNIRDWTPEALENRQSELLEVLHKNWKLGA